MLTQPRRLASAALAVVLGVTFVAVALFLGNGIRFSMERGIVGDLSEATVVITKKDRGGGSSSSSIPESYVTAVRSLPGVTGVKATAEQIFFQDLGGHRQSITVRTFLPESTGRISAGRQPQKSGEIVMTAAMASARSIGVGQEIRFSHGGDAPTVRGKVVGVVDPDPSGSGSAREMVFALGTDIAEWTGNSGVDEVHLVAPGTDAETLRAGAAALPGGQALTVRTKEGESAHRIGESKAMVGVATNLFLGFAGISVVVSGIVIANTFSILVLQRVRELALLRCVGATRRQVFRSVLREAVVLSLVASAGGVALGAALVTLLAALSEGTSMALGSQWVTPTAIIVPMLVGTVVTTFAAIVPARRATRVAPMAALRPEFAPLTKTRAGRVRILLGSLTFLVGTTALVLFSLAHTVVPAMAGGALSVIGVVMLGSVIVPPLAGLLGVLPARIAGLPGRLAVENSRRNPARAGSTASALFVGVTLITMMSVAAESGQASIAQELDRRAPVDALITFEGDLTGQVLDKVKQTSGVAAVGRQGRGQVTVTSADPAQTFELKREADGLGPDAEKAIRYRGFVEGLNQDTVLLNAKDHPEVRDGAKVVVTGPGGAKISLRAVARPDGPPTPTLTLENLRKVDPTARNAIAVRLADGQNPAKSVGTLSSSVSGVQAQVGGAIAARAEMERTTQKVLYVVTGLLAVAVVIALVGVGNTLGLSVLERTRESGLLRALGVTRRQARRMLGIEALILAAVGTTLGIAVGIGYGAAAVEAMLGKNIASIVVVVPWERLVLVTAVALVAGWTASVVPGRRSAKISPSSALATE
ncbi:ABC transporter permease [Austwickia chelonae]|uniref:ABC transporter permease n=1 Tax=Austwickia chelonae TaxID=100225 RepID=UPI0013C3330F|nr:FtsX family ABC transporter permease [Austwickia chelonae]